MKVTVGLRIQFCILSLLTSIRYISAEFYSRGPKTTTPEISPSNVKENYGNNIVVYFSPAVYQIKENKGSIKITLKVNRPIDNVYTAVVQYTLLPGSAGYLDFKAVTGNVTLVPEVNIYSFVVSVIDDKMTEYTEKFRAILTSLSENVVVGTPGKAVIKIIDNDKPILSSWSEWTPCNGSCMDKVGLSTRTRKCKESTGGAVKGLRCSDLARDWYCCLPICSGCTETVLNSNNKADFKVMSNSPHKTKALEGSGTFLKYFDRVLNYRIIAPIHHGCVLTIKQFCFTIVHADKVTISIVGLAERVVMSQVFDATRNRGEVSKCYKESDLNSALIMMIHIRAEAIKRRNRNNIKLRHVKVTGCKIAFTQIFPA